MVDAMVSNTIDFTVVRVRVSLPAQHQKSHPGFGVALIVFCKNVRLPCGTSSCPNEMAKWVGPRR